MEAFQGWPLHVNFARISAGANSKRISNDSGHSRYMYLGGTVISVKENLVQDNSVCPGVSMILF